VPALDTVPGTRNSNWKEQAMIRLGLILTMPLVGLTMAERGWSAEKELSGDRIRTEQGDLVVHPIQHATLAMQWGGKTIYVDPVGGAKTLADLPRPDLVLVTDVHGDHLDLPTLEALVPAGSRVRILAPKAVVEKLPEGPVRENAMVLGHGAKRELEGISIEAVPAYNLTRDRQRFHPKGRGNGYLLSLGGKKVYIAGDTEDIPEMLKLTGVDVAFLPMNLPYTMTVRQAANAVRHFRPKIVYPYHYRNGDGTLADLELFKKLVGPDSGVEVRLGKWYP
jgi:L-ascorbate metabolism protein UlaG (beta-lactamase superfamily)